MAKARAIVKRRRAVQNIRKITQTMQLISTARYQKCLQRALASQPYTRNITEMLQTLSAGAAIDHPLLRPNEGARESVLLVITSNRGLCGAYNAAILRKMIEARRTLEGLGLTPRMEMVGKKGVNYCRFLRIPLAERITDVEDKIAFDRVAEMAQRYMREYEAGKLARVDVVYTQFQSVSVQRPTIAELLPIAPPSTDTGPAAGAPGHPRTPRASDGGHGYGGETAGGPYEHRIEFEFSPEPERLLARLIPEAVKIRLYQAFNEAIVSEQVARMVAMKAATDAARDMAKLLTRQYNRARQSQITTELADIVGGANAVQ